MQYVNGWTLVGRRICTRRTVENAGAIFNPSIHGHASLLAIHGTATYRPSMDIKKGPQADLFLSSL